MVFYCEMCGAALEARPGDDMVVCAHCGARQTPPPCAPLPPGVTALLDERAAALLRRALLFLVDGDWKSADEYCEKVLDLRPEWAEAYVGKLMAELHVSHPDALGGCEWPLDGLDSYRKAVCFADAPLRARLENYLEQTRERIPQHYAEAKRIMTDDYCTRYADALAILERIPEYRDAQKLIEVCKRKLAGEDDPDSSGCITMGCGMILVFALISLIVIMVNAAQTLA